MATVLELDQAAVLDFKQTVLDQHDVVATCNRVPVHVDLLDDHGAVGTEQSFRRRVLQRSMAGV
jgi:O-methyltransferase involved in polyketide biosynthesis